MIYQNGTFNRDIHWIGAGSFGLVKNISEKPLIAAPARGDIPPVILPPGMLACPNFADIWDDSCDWIIGEESEMLKRYDYSNSADMIAGYGPFRIVELTEDIARRKK